MNNQNCNKKNTKAFIDNQNNNINYLTHYIMYIMCTVLLNNNKALEISFKVIEFQEPNFFIFFIY